METNKMKYNRKYKFARDAAHSILDISKTTGIPKSILQKVYNRGTGAWKGNLSSIRLKSGEKNPNTKAFPRAKRMSKEAWSFARIYSFVMGGKTQKTADKDLWLKYKNNNKSKK